MEKRREEEEQVLQAVRSIRARLPRIGVRKLHRMLREQDIIIGRDRLFQLLSQLGLLSTLFRKRRSFSKGPKAEPIPNLLNQEQITRPGQAIVTDITYLQTAEGTVYLNVFLDVHSRKALSVTLSTSLHSAHSLSALKEAVRNLESTAGVIHHSDHGSQYRAHEYTSYLKKKGMYQSMTGKFRCYDNAIVERFHNTLKNEFGLGAVIKSIRMAEKLVNDAVRIYNTERIHASLGFRTPDAVFRDAA